MNQKQLDWRYLKALHELYTQKSTDAKITGNDYIKNILMDQRKLIHYKSDNKKILVADLAYPLFYQQHFESNYLLYEQFLIAQGLETDARRRYTEYDIETLMFIAQEKEELIKNLTTQRTFSSQIFKSQGSKYLESKPALLEAVCKILGIIEFPDKDPKNLQWRFVVDCLDPQYIILCENIAHLKTPWKARENNIELWYVGGNNISMIDFISPNKLTKPIFYSCDWDYNGLDIFTRIKNKLSDKQCNIHLLLPYTYVTALPTSSPNHDSKWNFNKNLSGLSASAFFEEAILLINKLIKEDKWIEEESLDLLKLLHENLQLFPIS